MKKLHVLFSTLIAVAGMMMVGIAFLLWLPHSSAPTEAKASSPATPVGETLVIAATFDGDSAAVLSPDAVDLNTRDAMIGVEDEIALVSTIDSFDASGLAAIHRDDVLLPEDATLALALVIPPSAPALGVAASTLDWRRHHNDGDHDADDFFFHRIRFGETLSGIALRFGTTVHRLAVLNGIHHVNRIFAGRFLLIPG